MTKKDHLRDVTKGIRIIHLTGDLLGRKELTRCGIREGAVHIVGPAKVHQVTCPKCTNWYYDMRLRLSAKAFMARASTSVALAPQSADGSPPNR